MLQISFLISLCVFLLIACCYFFYQFYLLKQSLQKYKEINAEADKIILNSKNKLSFITEDDHQLVDYFPFSVVDFANKILVANSKVVKKVFLNSKKSAGEKNFYKNLPITNFIRDPEFLIFLKSTKKYYRLDVGLETTKEFLVVKNKLKKSRNKILFFFDAVEIGASSFVKKDFIAHTSHELRTPLTVLQGYLETIDSAYDTANVNNKIINKSLNQVYRMQNLIRDLLVFSDTAIKKLKKSDLVDLNVVVFSKQTIDYFKELYPKRASDLSEFFALNIAAFQNLYIQVKESLFESIIHNLLDNAIKYSKPGATVVLKWELCEDDLIIRVEDKGLGIAPFHQKKIFEDFYRISNYVGISEEFNMDEGFKSGNGLGLWIASKAAKLHQSELSLTSKVGVGSVFSIKILKKFIVKKDKT